MEWLFDGIGTELVGIVISFIIGAIGGGTIGHKIGIKQTAKQKQIAGDNAQQTQELRSASGGMGTIASKRRTSIKQSQKGGNNSVQSQIGGVNDGRR